MTPLGPFVAVPPFHTPRELYCPKCGIDSVTYPWAVVDPVSPRDLMEARLDPWLVVQGRGRRIGLTATCDCGHRTIWEWDVIQGTGRILAEL